MVIALGCGLSGWWAAKTTLSPVTITQLEDEQITIEVTEGTVGRSLTVSVTVNQPVQTIATNTLAGIVSSVDPDGEKALGDPIYSVAGVPVRLFGGDTPFYRELSRGSKGPDVTQLQQGLITLGFLKADKPDSAFGVATTNAVKQWQKSVGRPETGTVALGEILAAPNLPVSTSLGEDIVLGAQVSGGEDAFKTRTGEQEFVLVISPEQAQNITSDVSLRVFYEEHVWEAVVSQTHNDEAGNVVMTLASADGQVVCGPACEALPSDPQITLRAEAIVVPEVTGPAIPVGAIRVANDGDTYVVTAEDGELIVTVLGSSQGLAVVEGLTVGQEVLTPRLGDPATTDTGTTPGTTTEQP